MSEFEKKVETSTNFWTTFTSSIAEIRAVLGTLTPDVAEDLETIQKLKIQLSNLQSYATECTPLLPPYDVRRSQEELEILGRELKDTELLLKPKKKFSFASRSTGVKVPIVQKIEKSNDEIKEMKEEKETKKYPPGSYVVSGKKNEKVFLSGSELKLISAFGTNVQLLLTDCENVVISSPTIHGSVRLENLKNCQVYLGPCCTSVYIEECNDVLIYLSCHQLRIHRSQNCHLFVRVNSHPIIEDCTGFLFAPYNISYPGIENDFQASSLTNATCWDNVVDFRWHRNTPSPHWTIMPIKQRTSILSKELSDAGWFFNLTDLDSEIGELATSKTVDSDEAKDVEKEGVEEEEEL